MSGLPGTLQRPPKAAKADKFSSVQTVPFDLSIDPWWSLTVFGPPRTLQRPPKAAKAEKKISAQSVPFDLRFMEFMGLLEKSAMSAIKIDIKIALYSVSNRHDLNRNFPYDDFLRSNSCTTVLLIF